MSELKHSHTKNQQSIQLPEIILVTLGAINCFVVVIFFTISQPSVPGNYLADLWPFPGIYFLEILTIAVLATLSLKIGNPNRSSILNGIAWICSGFLLAFVILGAWTIGFFLLPAMIFFLIVGLISDRRRNGDIPLHFILFIASGIIQGLLMLVLVSI